MIYLDNCATTKPDIELATLALEMTGDSFGNPSSPHIVGQGAGDLLERARRKVAVALGCKTLDVIFTSGGTEANAIALNAFSVFSNQICSAVEHSSVYSSMLNKKAISLRADGTLNFEELDAALSSDPSTAFVSVMSVNNETGLILDPNGELRTLKKKYNFVLHVDAVQALGKIPIDLQELSHIDLLSISGHKIHGVKGIGALYVSPRMSSIKSIFSGGGQERAFRPGTQNMFGAVNLGLVIGAINLDAHSQVGKVRDLFETSVSDIAEPVVGAARVGNVSSLWLKTLGNTDLQGLEFFVDKMSEHGVCVSGFSACNTGMSTPSRVIQHMFPGDLDRAFNTIRISFRAGDVQYANSCIEDAAAALRIAIEETHNEREKRVCK